MNLLSNIDKKRKLFLLTNVIIIPYIISQKYVTKDNK